MTKLRVLDFHGWKVREKKGKKKKSTALGIPRRSPIQVLTGLDEIWLRSAGYIWHVFVIIRYLDKD